jgi:hypothetical protein
MKIMPNWCTNILSICGPPSEIDGFINVVKTGSEDETDSQGQDYAILERLYPIPDALKDLPSRFGSIADDDPDKNQKLKNVEDYGAVDWYDWCNANWGTKWADCHTEKVSENDCFPSGSDNNLKKVMFRFDSAWAPPLEGFNTIAMLFPKLVFDLRYEEPGMCFQGFRVWGNGEVQHEAEMEYMMSGEMAYDNIDWEYDSYCQGDGLGDEEE